MDLTPHSSKFMAALAALAKSDAIKLQQAQKHAVIKIQPEELNKMIAGICADHALYLADPVANSNKRANFTMLNLTGADFPPCDLTRAVFHYTTVIGPDTNLSRVKLDAEDIADSNMRITHTDIKNLPANLHDLWNMQTNVEITTAVDYDKKREATARLKVTQPLRTMPIIVRPTPAVNWPAPKKDGRML